MRIDYPSPNPPVITFSLADLATGLLRATQHAEDPALWGAIVLMVDSFDFDDIDSGDGQLLLEGLYDLSNGGELSGETVEVAHRRATRA